MTDRPHRVAKAKNQHWVPQFYLRHFATPATQGSKEPKVWIFAKNNGDPVLTNVRNVAAERYLYSPTGTDGARDWSMEEQLRSVETVLAPIWTQLATGFVDLSDVDLRRAVSLFVASLHLRHPRWRAQVEQIHSHLVAIFEDCPKDEHGDPIVDIIDHDGSTRAFDSSNYQRWKAAGPETLQRMFVESIRDQAGAFAQRLLQKRWSVVFAEEPVFISTDAPVVIVNPSRRPFGIITPGTVVSFPISPTRILMMDDRQDQPKGQYYALGPHGPGPANLTAWRWCERFMISPRPTDLVCAEILDWIDSQEENR